MSSQVLVIIFSKDRALQLDATLRSLTAHCRDPQRLSVKVLYTSERYQLQYETLARSYNEVGFFRESRFREDVLALLRGCAHVMFLVDDLIFTRPFCVREILTSLDMPDLFSFQLHSGRNTTYCYPLDCPISGLRFESLVRGISKYDWRTTNIRYPFDLSAAVYKGMPLTSRLESVPFSNPNELELEMNLEFERRRCPPYIAVYDKSVSFINPLNLVQSTYPGNRVGAMSGFDVESLARVFKEGYRIDIDAYRDLETSSAHAETKLELLAPSKADKL